MRWLEFKVVRWTKQPTIAASFAGSFAITPSTLE
jgi:hypothetical protein